MKRVLLLGAYGQTNLGDDLLMYNYLELLNQWGVQEIHVNVSQKDYIPPEVRSTAPNVIYHETYHTSILEWLRLVCSVDALVYGGGTLYKELYKATDRSRYGVIVRSLLFNLVARLLRKKVIHLHIGMGRLDTRLGRWITRAALQLAHLTIFRDQTSYEFARNTLHLRSRRLYQFTDALFADETLFGRQCAINLPPVPEDAIRVVGVNAVGESGLPDGYDPERYRQEFRKIIRQLVAEKNFVILVPFQPHFSPKNDVVFMQEQILDQLSDVERPWVYLLDSLPLSQIVSLFEKLDIFVATRFHSVLLACMTETPYIGIEYNTKCERFNSENSYPYCLGIDTFSQENFHQVYLSLLNNLSSVKPLLSSMKETNRRLGQESLRVTLETLKITGAARP